MSAKELEEDSDRLRRDAKSLETTRMSTIREVEEAAVEVRVYEV
jgi:hypothetical protein